MKTKRGFTLIELIVVIAIIGVLAAILVPTMMGYIKKSKIASANETASAVYKAINSALMELDQENVDISGAYTLEWSADSEVWEADGHASNDMKNILGKKELLSTKVKIFFDKMDKVKNCKVAVSDSACLAASVARDSTYTGTYPAGVVSGKNYEYYVPMKSGTAMDSALAEALILVFGGSLSETGYQSAKAEAAKKGFNIEFAYQGKSSLGLI